MSSSCNTESVIPQWVTFVFLTCTILMLIATSIYSAQLLKHDQDVQKKWNDYGCCKKFKLWAKDVWGRKAVYVPLIAHLSDTATDFASVVEFYQIGSTSNPEDCNGLNVMALFVISISCMFLYRIISSWTIYRITQSTQRVILQFLDIELFRVLYISHFMGLSSKSSPQRLISGLEAIFEASPQAVIQILYLIKTGSMSNIILYSAVISLFNLTTCIISDDKSHLELKWSQDECCSFILLYFFRFCDIPSKILTFVFVWYFINGYFCIIVVAFDILVAVVLYATIKKTDALISIIAVPFGFGEYQLDDPWICYMCYSVSAAFGITTTLLVFAVKDDFINDAPFVVIAFIFCVVASVLKWCLYCGLFASEPGANAINLIKDKERSDVNHLIDSKSFNDALELILYQNHDIKTIKTEIFYGMHRYSLLAIAAQTRNMKVFNLILNERGLDNYGHNESNRASITALQCAVGDKTMMKRIMTHMDIKVEYIAYTSIDDPSSVLYKVIIRQDLDLLEWFLETFSRQFIYYQDRVTLLNVSRCKGRESLLFEIKDTMDSFQIFQTLYGFYPTNYDKQPILEEILKDWDWDKHQSNELYQIKEFIHEELNYLNNTRS